MKTIMLIVALGLGTLLAGCNPTLVGCNSDISLKDNEWISHSSPGIYAVSKVVKIKGHEYIIVCCQRGGGIIHAESCSCKK